MNGSPVTADFGSFEGPLVVFGGVYSNLQAVRALTDVLQRRAAICTGDILAYGADPQASVDAVRALGCPVVAGNCERQIGNGSDDCGCGFEEGTACDLASGAWFAHASAQVTEDTKAWMRNLPDIATLYHQGKRYAVVHGGARENNRFLWPSTTGEVFQEEIAQLETLLGPIDGVLAGHSGIAFQRVIDGKLWLNAGVIGMPPHDGRPETRCAVLGDDGAVIHRLIYDADGARSAMEEAGLTQGYEVALTTGIWPSEDVLPPELCR